MSNEALIAAFVAAVPGILAVGMAFARGKVNTSELERVRDKIHDVLTPSIEALQREVSILNTTVNTIGDIPGMRVAVGLLSAEVASLRHDVARVRSEGT